MIPKTAEVYLRYEKYIIRNDLLYSFRVISIFSHCFQAAIRDPDPVVFLENELVYGTTFDISDDVLDENFVLPIGKAKVQKEGKDITLVAHSIGVKFCMDAAEILAKEGISCEVINLRSIRPLDIDTVNESVKKTHHLITVEGKMFVLNTDQQFAMILFTAFLTTNSGAV